MSLISDIIGILLGAILGYYGVKFTRFEQREGRLYYCPNIWIGTTVTLLFLGRLIYRFYALFSFGALSGNEHGQTQYQMVSSNSWAAGLLLVMFAYYIIYYAILLKKQKQFSQLEKDTLPF